MGNQFPLISVTARKCFSYLYKEERTGLDDTNITHILDTEDTFYAVPQCS